MEEQATALGAAGRKFEKVLEEYQSKLKANEQTQELLQELADAAWELILQREFVGFVHGNIEWLKRSYQIPEEVFKLIGKSKNSNLADPAHRLIAALEFQVTHEK